MAIALISCLTMLTACSDPGPGGDGITNPPPSTPRVTSISIVPSQISIRTGERLIVTAELRDQNGNLMQGQSPGWTTSSTTVASVNPAGATATVTGIAPGAATIQATLGGVVGSAPLTVAPPFTAAPVASVRVTPSALSLAPGATAVLTADALDANGNVLSDRTPFWSSSNPSVATVSNGVVTSLGGGSTTISATIEGRVGIAAVSVTAPQSQVTLVVTNQLIAAVAIRAQGQAIGVVPALSTRQATVPSAPTLDVTFEVIEPQLGGRVLGDRMSGRWTLTTPSGTVNLNIDNLVGSQWYFAPLVSNLSGTSLLMAINFGLQSENRCNCTVPIGGQRVFLGYYRLYSNSLVHAFASGSGYTGSYRYFSDFGNLIPRGSGVRDFTYNVFP
ncbi:MAG: Ig-like domain-containing protein [Gemmatimonadetes bacterium]|nr:Ig-like domain-containing protein [Gemmatimonadota bacterium]